MTSDDLTPGSLTVSQSSRVARAQDASKANDPLSLWSSSARLYLDTFYKRVCFALNLWLLTSSRYVNMIFKHIRRHNAGFIRDLAKAGSVGFVETAVEQVGLFCVAMKAGAQRFIIDARASIQHLLNPLSRPLLTG